MGNKQYATQMAKVLDPKGVLFAGRVISRGNDAETVCKDLERVLGLKSSVVIIDDSVGVWPHNKRNLIAVGLCVIACNSLKCDILWSLLSLVLSGSIIPLLSFKILQVLILPL